MGPGYRVEFGKGAQKALKRMDKHQAHIIMAWVQKHLVNCTNPRQYGKGLTADRAGAWRYRIGDYRLIADINDKTVTILLLEIGHRRNIYEIMGDRPAGFSEDTTYGRVFGVNNQGKILAGVWDDNDENPLSEFDGLPSAWLDEMVRKAGFPDAFKPL